VTVTGGIAAQPAKASLATWVGFAAMGLGMFMAILDIQVVATSLPTIRFELDIPADRMSYVQTAYLIAEVISIPLTGWLTRMLGMRLLFVGALALFTAASVGCASADGFGTLIAWRTLQGFAGGTLIPTVFAAVFLLFPLAQQGLATTIAGVLAVLAPTVGPIVGGWITETWSWHWLFLVNVAPGIAALAVAALALPRRAADWSELARVDAAALVLLAVALAALEIGLKEAPGRGWTAAPVLALLGSAALAGTLFVRRTLAAAHPLVALDVFRDRDFAVGATLSFTLGMALYGSVYLMPVFLGLVRGHGALATGEIMLATGAAQLLTAPIAVALERRVEARLLTAAGFLLFAIGLAMSVGDNRLSDGADLFWPQIVRGAAIMFCLLPPTRLALGRLSPEAVTDASGLFNLMRNLGGAIGLALIDTVIFGRAPGHALAMKERVLARDPEAARILDIPEEMRALDPSNLDPDLAEALARRLEQSGIADAVSEAWLMLALISLASLALLPLARRHKPVAGQGVAGH
jgi:DHA2 family multidrug resistance protein